MKRLILLLPALSVATGAFAAAQLYRWVDEKGNVEYRDTPPPASAKKVEQRPVVAAPRSRPRRCPISVQQAAKNFPVTLWAYDCGDAVRRTRARTSRAAACPTPRRTRRPDLEAFKKLTGGDERAGALRRIDQAHGLSRGRLGQRARRRGLPADRAAPRGETGSEAGSQARHGDRKPRPRSSRLRRLRRPRTGPSRKRRRRRSSPTRGRACRVRSNAPPGLQRKQGTPRQDAVPVRWNQPSSHGQRPLRRVGRRLELVGIHEVGEHRVGADQVGQGHGPALPEAGGSRDRTCALLTLRLRSSSRVKSTTVCSSAARPVKARFSRRLSTMSPRTPSRLRGRSVGIPDVGTIHLARHRQHDDLLQGLRHARLVADQQAHGLRIAARAPACAAAARTGPESGCFPRCFTKAS